MKRRIASLFFLASFLFTIAAGSFAPFIPVPRAQAAAGANFTLNYPDDNEFKGDLRAAAKDGGIGNDDITNVLSKTVMFTKGGRIGTAPLKFSGSFSNKNDIPTYSVEYYCYPTEDYKIDTSAPNYSKPFVRYVMGVTLEENGDWAGLATNGPYTTHVGVLGNSEVGTIHFPKQVKNSGDGNIAAKDFPVFGKGGDHDVRYDVENHILDDKIETSFEDAFEGKYGFNKYDSSLPKADKTKDVLKKCMPANTGDLGKATSFLPKDPNKAAWDTAIKQAKLGETAQEAAANITGSSSGAGADNSKMSCKVDGLSLNPAEMLENVLNWLFCGFVQGLMGIVDSLDNMINSMLSIGSPGNQGEPSEIFGANNGSSCKDGETCYAYYAAWESFRNIALGLMLIAGLIVLISQALGMELLDAYTIRKVLPRLLIAALAITLSWQLMQFAVEFTNDLGYGIRRLIYAPFDNLNSGISVNLGESFALAIFTGLGFAFAGLFGLLSLAGTAALALFVAFLVLILREIAIIMLIIMAPIGIVAYILPNTQRVYKLWWESFSKALLMFPLIAALIAAGRVFSAIAISQGGTINQVIGFCAYFAPYFLLPMTFQFAGGFVRQLGGFVNDRSQGMSGALRNFRSGQLKKNTAALKSGTRYEGKRWIPGSMTAADRFNEMSKGVGTGWTGRFGVPTARGKQARAYVDQLAGQEARQSDGLKAIRGKNNANRILAAGFGDERRGRKALYEHLMNGGDDGKFGAGKTQEEKRAMATAAVDEAAMMAKVAGGFNKANAIGAFYNMAADGTAFRNPNDLAKLAAVVGGDDHNNTYTYAAEAASISKQAGRHDIGASPEAIGKQALAESDEMAQRTGADRLFGGTESIDELRFESWYSAATSANRYTRHSNDKGRSMEFTAAEATRIFMDPNANPEHRKKAASVLKGDLDFARSGQGKSGNAERTLKGVASAGGSVANVEQALENYMYGAPKTDANGQVQYKTQEVQRPGADGNVSTVREYVTNAAGDRIPDRDLTPEGKEIQDLIGRQGGPSQAEIEAERARGGGGGGTGGGGGDDN